MEKLLHSVRVINKASEGKGDYHYITLITRRAALKIFAMTRRWSLSDFAPYPVSPLLRKLKGKLAPPSQRVNSVPAPALRAFSPMLC